MGEKKTEIVTDFIFLGSKITLEGVNVKDACSLEIIYEQPIQCIKKQTHHFDNKDPYNQKL